MEEKKNLLELPSERKEISAEGKSAALGCEKPSFVGYRSRYRYQSALLVSM